MTAGAVSSLTGDINLDGARLDHDFVHANGQRLHVVKSGPEDGSIVLLLHGFPEFWYGWRHQIPALARFGFRVWVPDQRGYNLSDKPKGIESYGIEHLVEDVVGLVDASGRDRIHLVGHDWGAVVAWRFARRFPERLESLAILNGPISSVMARHLRESRHQLRKSWYMLFFQLPMIPEMLMNSGNWRLGLRALQASGRPETFDSADLEMYRRAWSKPRAMTSMINWYRAMRYPSNRRARRRIGVPTLLIWGARDTFLNVELARQSIDYCENGRLVYLEEASHWVQHDEFEKVNQLLVGFLTDNFHEEE